MLPGLWLPITGRNPMNTTEYNLKARTETVKVKYKEMPSERLKRVALHIHFPGNFQNGGQIFKLT